MHLIKKDSWIMNKIVCGSDMVWTTIGLNAGLSTLKFSFYLKFQFVTETLFQKHISYSFCETYFTFSFQKWKQKLLLWNFQTFWMDHFLNEAKKLFSKIWKQVFPFDIFCEKKKKYFLLFWKGWGKFPWGRK